MACMRSPVQIRLAPPNFDIRICGAIAQLVERMVRNHEATGSNPVSSTSPYLTDSFCT